MILCGIPGYDIPALTFLEWLRPDKVVHLVMFGVLSFLLLRGFNRQERFPFLNKNASVLAVVISATYGGITEILQEYVFIHRTGDIRDEMANTVGALMGLWVYRRTLLKKSFEH